MIFEWHPLHCRLLVADPARQLLRHTLATLAYRGGKAVRGAPDSFAQFRASEQTRTPVDILAHIGDLMDWALSIAQGQQRWHRFSCLLPWDAEVRRFFTALEAFEAYLASNNPMHEPAEKLFQGPIADALTHVGQIAMLRRLAGVPVRGENYHHAHILTGRVGIDQAPAGQKSSVRNQRFSSSCWTFTGFRVSGLDGSDVEPARTFSSARSSINHGGQDDHRNQTKCRGHCALGPSGAKSKEPPQALLAAIGIEKQGQQTPSPSATSAGTGRPVTTRTSGSVAPGGRLKDFRTRAAVR